MTIVHLCPRCGAPNGRGDLAGLCAKHTREDNARRNKKRKDSGRATAAWQRMRLAAFHRDGYACRRCGSIGDRHTLTVHLRPELGGNHFAATLADLTTYCRRCHGSVDAPRSQHPRRAEQTYSEPAIG